jgi:hypothetical protein
LIHRGLFLLNRGASSTPDPFLDRRHHRRKALLVSRGQGSVCDVQVGLVPWFPTFKTEGCQSAPVKLDRVQSLPAEVSGFQVHRSRSGVGVEPRGARVLPVLSEDAIGTGCQ